MSILKRFIRDMRKEGHGALACYDFVPSDYAMETVQCAIFHATRLSMQESKYKDVFDPHIQRLKGVIKKPTNKNAVCALIDINLAGLENTEYYSNIYPDTTMTPLNLRHIIRGVANINDLLEKNGYYRVITHEIVLTHLALTYFIEQGNRLTQKSITPAIQKDLDFAKETISPISIMYTNILINHEART